MLFDQVDVIKDCGPKSTMSLLKLRGDKLIFIIFIVYYYGVDDVL